MLFLFSREACLAIRESSHESVHSLLKEERRKVGNVQCLWNWPEHGLLQGACSASQFLSCKVNKWSSVGKFLYAMLKKINAEANPNVCHPVLRKFKATSVSKAVSCASFIRVWLLSLGQGFVCTEMPSRLLQVLNSSSGQWKLHAFHAVGNQTTCRCLSSVTFWFCGWPL